jgi:hypothetical protein
LDDQKVLAIIDNFGTVTVCPGGIVHVNMPHVSIKLMPSDFVKFTELIAAARINFDPPQRMSGKARLQLVTPESETTQEDDDNQTK